MELIFVTGNIEKLREVADILGKDFNISGKVIDLPEIQDLDAEKIVFNKAQSAFDLINKPIIVEDTSLYIKGWNGLPGPFNKWFMRTVGNEGIIKMLSGYNDRSALAETIFAYHDTKEIKIFKGIVKGSISDTIRGEGGFGWDKIFIPDGLEKTQAELSSSKKNKISARKRALEKLKAYLLKNEK